MELQLEKKGVPTDRHNLMEIKYLKRRDGEIKTANLKYLIVEKKSLIIIKEKFPPSFTQDKNN